MANKDFKVKNGIDIQSPLPVTMGGTGQTSTTNTLNALLPSQAGNSGKVLSSDGTNTTWTTPVKGLNSGTAAQRPGSPSTGDLYFNTDDMEIEVYQNGNWLIANTIPGIPTGVTATDQGSGRAFNNGQASVVFTPATSGGPVKNFIVTPSPSTSPTTFTGTSSPVTVTGLASSTQYTYTVAASSNIGTSSASSASSGVTATTVPQAPTLTAAANNETSVIITITPGSTGGSAITQYSITSNPATTTQTTSNTSYTFTGLTTGTSYTFTATATNANGTSQASAASNAVIAAVPNNFISIASTYVSSPTSTITFSSIPNTYKHLQLRCSIKDTYTNPSVEFSDLAMRFNGDSSSTYYWYYYGVNGSGSLIMNNGTANAQYMSVWYAYGGSSGNTNYAPTILDIHDYANTNKKKSVMAIGGGVGNNLNNSRVLVGSGHWPSMNAINSITLNAGTTSFKAGTIVSLYGI